MTTLAVEPAALRPVGERSARSTLRTVWERRDFVRMLATTQLQAQNSDSVLGNLWHLLNPLSLALVFYLVFGLLLGAAEDSDAYISFLVVGLLTFTWTRKSVSAGSRSVVRNLNLVRSMAFPRATLPLASVVAESVAHVYAVGAMVVVVVLVGQRPSATWLLLPVVLVLQGLMGTGLALMAARATHHLRDVEQALPYALRLWMYVSGVFYAEERLPEGWLRDLFGINPAFVAIDVTRDVLGGTVDVGRLGLLAAWAVGLAVVGWRFFVAREHEYGRA